MKAGRLLRTTIYRQKDGYLEVSVDGSTFTPTPTTSSISVKGIGGSGGVANGHLPSASTDSGVDLKGTK